MEHSASFSDTAEPDLLIELAEIRNPYERGMTLEQAVERVTSEVVSSYFPLLRSQVSGPLREVCLPIEKEDLARVVRKVAQRLQEAGLLREIVQLEPPDERETLSGFRES